MKLTFVSVTLITLLLTGCPSDDGGTSDIDSGPADIDAGPDAGGEPDAAGPDASAACQEATEHDDLGWIAANIFAKSCTFSSCHNDSISPKGGLTLTPEMAFLELVDVDSTQAPGKKRVVPGDCESSYLYQKISNMDLGTKLPMPPNQQGQPFVPLCAEKQQAICNWIEAGANDD